MSIALLHFLIKKQQNEGYMLFLLLISGYVLLRIFQVDMAYYSLIVPALFILQSFGVYMSYVYCQKYSSENKKNPNWILFYGWKVKTKSQQRERISTDIIALSVQFQL